VAKVKVVNTKIDSNLNGNNFTDTPSNTIFSFGSFNITSNFDDKVSIDYSKTLSTFVRPVTLETLGFTEKQSEIINNTTTNLVLNLNNSDLNTFVRYGSAYEFLRVSIQNIILAYPASLFALTTGGNPTYAYLTYDPVSNISTFGVPINRIVNNFGLIYNDSNQSIPDDNELKNLNLSYEKYVISTSLEPEIPYDVIGFSGYSENSSDFQRRNYIMFNVEGNPFHLMGTGETGNLDFHIKPNNVVFEEFRAELNPYEKYIVSERNGVRGFEFTLKTPVLLDNGEIIYSNTLAQWSTSDGYNIDINNTNYQRFLEVVLTIGAKYDKIKTDLIARFLTPSSLKTYDLTEEGKMTKLLRIYGREFDQIRQFIDSLVYVNKISYDKINNIPDQIVKNLSKTFGWEYFSLVNESELMDSFLSIDEKERNLNEDLLPAEIDVELWRRILNNTNYFWKSKGTRESLKSMFLLIGIPEPFINITEYVYTVEGKINPNTVTLSQYDFPTSSLPYDNSGYPVAPLETKDFYFQISGDTDAGKRYMDVFRMAGFNLIETIDNKKSWVEEGSITRIHYSTPQYYQEDSKLVLNTKAIDVALDTARGIEFDVFTYIKDVDFPANNSGYTLPFSYVNISLAYTGSENTFTLPIDYDKYEGDLEVRFNGILLNAPKTGSTSGITTNADYSVSGNSFTLLTASATSNTSRRDVIQATFIYSGDSQPITGITVNYVVTRISANPSGTEIPLPSKPRGDVQLTINGIALTKGVGGLTGDYSVDSENDKIIVYNSDVISYLMINPQIQVSYIEVDGSDSINLRSEVVRIDSFNTSKIYFNQSANKYVFKLNYKVNDAKEIKFLVDGIALEPYKDYNINTMNPFEVYLPKGMKYGMVISVYYLVGGDEIFTPVVSDDFGLGDITKLSFLEFLELIQRRMINARTRKTITNSKGGWYPTVQKIYETYLKRSTLNSNNSLLSNGYTFQNLYPFLSKYNAFFQRFVDQLLSATVIMKKGGLLVRNGLFTKQKFAYKRGVNLFKEIVDDELIDNRNQMLFQYLGSDGATFKVSQPSEDVPPPFVLSVETKSGTAGYREITETIESGFSFEIQTIMDGYISNAGGINVSGYTDVISYGIEYRGTMAREQPWIPNIITDTLETNSYTIPMISGLTPGNSYEYRAIVNTPTLSAVGSKLTIVIPEPEPPLVPSGMTKLHTSVTETTICNAGGCNIQGYEDVQWYGVEYEEISTGVPFNVTPSSFTNISPASTTCSVTICGDITNSYTRQAVAGGTPITWLIPATPEIPTPTGIQQTIGIQTNTSTSSRTGCVVYTPAIGTPKIVEFTQLGATVQKTINVVNETGYPDTFPAEYPENGGGYLICICDAGYLTQPFVGESYNLTLSYYFCKDVTNAAHVQHVQCVCATCNGGLIGEESWGQKAAGSCSGSFATKTINNGDVVRLYARASTQDKDKFPSIARISFDVSGNGYVKGSPSIVEAKTCTTQSDEQQGVR